jgi:hypothetical protein
MLLRNTVKGTGSWDLRPSVFSSNNPPRALPLIHGLKPFRIWLHIRRENRFENRQNLDPAGKNQSSTLIFTYSSNHIYVMFTYFFSFSYGFPLNDPIIIFANDPMVSSQRSQWGHGIFNKNFDVGSRGIIDTAGSDSYGIIDTAVSDPAVSLTPRNLNVANDYLNFLGEYEAKRI